MLKAKRIAKVMLCICIAFSMFISVSAQIDSIKVGENQFNLSNNDIPVITNYINNNTQYKIISRYSGTATKDNITINTNNNITIAIWNGYAFTAPSYIFNNVIGNSNIESEITLTQPSRRTVFIVNVVPENNVAKFNISTLFSDGSGSPISISLIYILTIPTINNIINNLNSVFNNLINIYNSIINFLTDKPWVILLGITVSLLSFLIYKAKSII